MDDDDMQTLGAAVADASGPETPPTEDDAPVVPAVGDLLRAYSAQEAALIAFQRLGLSATEAHQAAGAYDARRATTLDPAGPQLAARNVEVYDAVADVYAKSATMAEVREADAGQIKALRAAAEVYTERSQTARYWLWGTRITTGVLGIFGIRRLRD